jgi:hypothetical protein
MTTVEKHTLESALPHSPLTGLTKAREHALSECTNDATTILATVSEWDSEFVVLTLMPEDGFLLETWLDPESVRDFYTSRILARHHTLAQYRLNEVNASWYQFTEQWGDLHWISTSSLRQVHVAGIFPVWTDGILGEICWHEPAWSSRPFGRAEQMELSRQLDAFDAAWRDGDLDAKLATVQDESYSGIRVVEAAGDRRFRAIARGKDELRAAWGAPEFGQVLELERLHQCTQSWYVFASYRMRLRVRDRVVDRESALLLPVGPDGKFIGELSYSMETEA